LGGNRTGGWLPFQKGKTQAWKKWGAHGGSREKKGGEETLHLKGKGGGGEVGEKGGGAQTALIYREQSGGKEKSHVDLFFFGGGEKKRG